MCWFGGVGNIRRAERRISGTLGLTTLHCKTPVSQRAKDRTRFMVEKHCDYKSRYTYEMFHHTNYHKYCNCFLGRAFPILISRCNRRWLIKYKRLGLQNSDLRQQPSLLSTPKAEAYASAFESTITNYEVCFLLPTLLTIERLTRCAGYKFRMSRPVDGFSEYTRYEIAIGDRKKPRKVVFLSSARERGVWMLC